MFRVKGLVFRGPYNKGYSNLGSRYGVPQFWETNIRPEPLAGNLACPDLLKKPSPQYEPIATLGNLGNCEGRSIFLGSFRGSGCLIVRYCS